MKNKNLDRIWLIFLMTLAFNLFTASSGYSQIETANKQETIDLRKEKIFVKYFNNFKMLVRKNDSKGLAKLFDNTYPELLVLVDNKNSKLNKHKQVIIKNRSEFISYYPKIFDKRMRNLIHETEIQDLQLMEGGIKLGIGQVWWLYDVKKKEIKLSYLANYEGLF